MPNTYNLPPDKDLLPRTDGAVVKFVVSSKTSPTDSEIEKVLDKFRGEQKQIPPIVFESNDNFIVGFVDGLLSSDG